jgi:hypothetical protein
MQPQNRLTHFAAEKLRRHEAQPFKFGSGADVRLYSPVLARYVWVSGTVADRVPHADVSMLGMFLRVSIPGLGIVSARMYCGACELCLIRDSTPRERAESGCAHVRCSTCVSGLMEWDSFYRDEHRDGETDEEFTARYVVELAVVR